MLGLGLVGALLLAHEPWRHSALALVRLPFTFLRAAVRLVILLPRLPSLVEDNARLRHALTARELEVSAARETLRQQHAAGALQAAWPQAAGRLASALARSPLPTQQTLLIDQGRRHGVSEAALVVDAQGVVGRILEAQDATSLVLMLTDPNSRIAGLIERSRETGLLIGRGFSECHLTYLGLEADVQVGDRVVTAGLGGAVPKGLLLGTVTRVERLERAGATRATVTPAASLGRLEEVLCLPPAS
ncbi:MAG: rod shape-determining protein MreC [Gemmatimonadales bacterium]|nr:rod shape-determining protein MreC [Gemmatimonadales bacterium]